MAEEKEHKHNWQLDRTQGLLITSKKDFEIMPNAVGIFVCECGAVKSVRLK